MAKKKTWKGAQNHYLIETCKPKLKWGTTSHQSEWQSSKSQQISTREGVGEKKPSYTDGGIVNWYIHYGEQYGGSLKETKRVTIWSCNPIPKAISTEYFN